MPRWNCDASAETFCECSWIGYAGGDLAHWASERHVFALGTLAWWLAC
jgi:hypothetical protein